MLSNACDRVSANASPRSLLSFYIGECEPFRSAGRVFTSPAIARNLKR